MAILGMEDLTKALQGLLQQVEPAIQKELEAAAQNTYDASQVDCPVGPDSAGHTHMKDTGHVDSSPGLVEVTYDAEYALFVHEGHMSRSGRPVPAQPFLEPHFEAESEALLERLKGL